MPDVLTPSCRMLQLVMGRFASQAVIVAARLGVADAIGDGVLSGADLAFSLGTREAPLVRLLGALAALGVVQDTGAGWALTPLGHSLRPNAPHSVHDAVLFLGSPEHDAAWSGLEHSLRTGRSGFTHVHGVSFWDHMEAHPGLARRFDGMIAGNAAMFRDAVLATCDFSTFGTLVDLGGSQGVVLCGILQRNPALRGILFDHPDRVAAARAVVARAGLAERCEVIEGDFFAGVPVRADAYLMTSVLHDWDDDRAVALLGNIRSVMPENARVLAGELVLQPPGGMDPARLLDLEMLVMTEGGRERTEDDFRDLFARAGLRLERILPTSAWQSLLEAVAA
ncbi:Methyltransf_2 domain-containing protein [Rhodovastum atsumiense]|uniref:Uncharacterized protein n=1 Tax=Rhodovastum atsumiense TaxID=504468 RepID=A0A5M6INQ6_9PROT|nr:methyltransferase [Rhodovastum atsumiense]KAA5609906.1 hypothetical protein F1189_21675 [Rhodovastum atsumiense]CAH2604521.1 Methyltransf_2 domain-containing protein [Rhodovastum atsumiense]